MAWHWSGRSDAALRSAADSLITGLADVRQVAAPPQLQLAVPQRRRRAVLPAVGGRGRYTARSTASSPKWSETKVPAASIGAVPTSSIDAGRQRRVREDAIDPLAALRARREPHQVALRVDRVAGIVGPQRRPHVGEGGRGPRLERRGLERRAPTPARSSCRRRARRPRGPASSGRMIRSCSGPLRRAARRASRGGRWRRRARRRAAPRGAVGPWRSAGTASRARRSARARGSRRRSRGDPARDSGVPRAPTARVDRRQERRRHLLQRDRPAGAAPAPPAARPPAAGTGAPRTTRSTSGSAAPPAPRPAPRSPHWPARPPPPSGPPIPQRAVEARRCVRLQLHRQVSFESAAHGSRENEDRRRHHEAGRQERQDQRWPAKPGCASSSAVGREPRRAREVIERRRAPRRVRVVEHGLALVVLEPRRRQRLDRRGVAPAVHLVLEGERHDRGRR